MALPEFAGEAEFRARWINPFLQKLGYTMVTHPTVRTNMAKIIFLQTSTDSSTCGFSQLRQNLVMLVRETLSLKNCSIK